LIPKKKREIFPYLSGTISKLSEDLAVRSNIKILSFSSCYNASRAVLISPTY